MAAPRRVIRPDGSERAFLLTEFEGRPALLVRPAPGPMGIPEAESYFKIGRHLRARGVPVPEVLAWDPGSGEVVVEFLEGERLFERARGASSKERLRLYKEAVEALSLLQVRGAEGFDPEWCYEAPEWNRRTAVEREALYFTRFFVARLLDRGRDEALEAELIRFGAEVDRLEYTGYLLHRDFQSRNLLVQGGKVRILDFQGARLGPLAYDLASLILDPYMELSFSEREAVFQMYLEAVRAQGVEADEGLLSRDLTVVGLFRILQALGAFSYLSLMKGKEQFREFLSPGVRILKEWAARPEFDGLGRLRSLLKEL